MAIDRDIEKTFSLQDFIAELRRLADTLEAGTDYEIEMDDEKITLPAHATFSIEHEREDGHQEIEFQISWSDEDEEDADEQDENEDENEEAVIA